MLMAPAAVSLIVAYPFWRKGGMIFGNIVGTAVIFGTAFGLIMREYVETGSRHPGLPRCRRRVFSRTERFHTIRDLCLHRAGRGLRLICPEPQGREEASRQGLRARMAMTSAAGCPKCGSPALPEALECPRCGVIFAKFEHRMAEAAAEPPLPVAQRVTAVAQEDPLAAAARLGRGVVLAGLLVWTWQFARAPMGAGVMDSVLHLPNLIFHEAGHVLFSPFGRFMTVLGGSLFQVLVPVTCAVAFLRQKDAFAAAVCTWWAGQNFLDLAPYIADAARAAARAPWRTHRS